MELSPKARASTAGIVVDDSACDVDDLTPCGGVQVTVPGGHEWDALVALAVESGWPGVELLSGVGGTVADVVRRNAAAHGQSVDETVAAVRTWDRAADRQRTFAWGDCGFGPGTSRFQEHLPDGRVCYDVLDVTFQFKQGDLTAPVREEGLARLLGVGLGHRAPLAAVRDAAREAIRDTARDSVGEAVPTARRA